MRPEAGLSLNGLLNEDALVAQFCLHAVSLRSPSDYGEGGGREAGLRERRALPKSSRRRRGGRARADQRIADAHMGSNGTTEITGQKDGPQNGGLRNHIEGDADQEDDANRHSEVRRISEIGESLHDRTSLDQFDDRIEEQKQHWQPGKYPSSPYPLLRCWCSLSVRGHEFFLLVFTPGKTTDM